MPNLTNINTILSQAPFPLPKDQIINLLSNQGVDNQVINSLEKSNYYIFTDPNQVISEIVQNSTKNY